MKEKIQFEDLTSLKNILPTAIGAVFCLICGILIVRDQTTIYFAILGIIGIALIGIPQIKNIRRRNTIKYNNTGLTAKFLGRKTFGFQFSEIEHISLIEKGLILNIKGMDEVTLSRKRFQEDSLQQLHTLIKQKTTQS
ncbi:MAG: hypothetical protein ACSHWW_08100 [Nonlabens sp.]|uniref:hypothetical protein n=1 Tax=Nonlabens sp. TaxID=1888209 RepID=UPI003EFAC88E